jgi:YaiO family outer membrane protein
MKFVPLCLGALLAISPASHAGLYEDGLRAKQAGQFEQAAELLGRATEASPRNVEAWFHYGTVLGWLKRHDEALAALRRGLQLAPRDFDLRLGEARVLAWMADYAAAETRLDSLAREYPGNTDVEVMQGRVAFWRKDEAGAQRIYESILEREPTQVDALTGLGDIYAGRGEVEPARVHYTRALAQDPSPEIQAKVAALKDLPTMRLHLGLTGSTFARGQRDNWWSMYAALARRIHKVDAWARIEQAERFGFHDLTFEVGASVPLSKALQVSAFGGFTPDADFFPRYHAELNLRVRLYERVGSLGSGWFLAEGRVADYAASRVIITRLGWEQELARGWTMNARWLHLNYENGDSTDGWIAYLTYEPREGWLYRLGAARSVESLTNQTLRDGETSQSWTLFAGVIFPVAADWQVRLDFEREEVEQSVIRYGGAIGVIHQF